MPSAHVIITSIHNGALSVCSINCFRPILLSWCSLSMRPSKPTDLFSTETFLDRLLVVVPESNAESLPSTSFPATNYFVLFHLLPSFVSTFRFRQDCGRKESSLFVRANRSRVLLTSRAVASAAHDAASVILVSESGNALRVVLV